MIQGSIPADIVMQNDDVMVIKDIAPKATVHYLSIPNKHIADVTSLSKDNSSLVGTLFLAAKELASHLLAAFPPATGAYLELLIDPRQQFEDLVYLLAKELPELKIGDEGKLRKPIQVSGEILISRLYVHVGHDTRKADLKQRHEKAAWGCN